MRNKRKYLFNYSTYIAFQIQGDLLLTDELISEVLKNNRISEIYISGDLINYDKRMDHINIFKTNSYKSNSKPYVNMVYYNLKKNKKIKKKYNKYSNLYVLYSIYFNKH